MVGHALSICNAALVLSAGVLGLAGCTADGGPPLAPAPAAGGPAVDLPTLPGPPRPPPPPISGGTLLVAHDGHTAVAADPDRDAVWIVDLARQAVQARVVLLPGDQPGRVAGDGGGRAFVVLRGGGALATIDLGTRSVTERRNVCAAPRGVAYDARNDVVHVACAGGELVTLPAVGGSPLRTLQLDDDLRDVVVEGDSLWVSRFRSAQVLIVGSDGSVRRVQPITLPDPTQMGTNGPAQLEPAVAWRMISMPGGGVALAHQRATTADAIPIKPGGYDSPGMCGTAGLMSSAVTVIGGDATVSTAPVLAGVALPLDMALSSDGTRMSLLSQGGLITLGMDLLTMSKLPCTSVLEPYCGWTPGLVAVAYDGQDRVVVQLRDPAAIYIFPGLDYGSPELVRIPLPGEYRGDAGLDLFHAVTPAALACASCHPEGGDDGRVWHFAGLGLRRTKSGRGGLLGTEPFHWGGDMKDFAQLAHDVFSGRMSGRALDQFEVDAMASWLDHQQVPALSPPQDPAAVARGKTLFEDASVGCTGCHSGAKFTNRQIVDVGTGGLFKVPSLHGLAWRPPYLHDGRAATLRDRFGPGGGGDQHGHTSQLVPEQIDDLVAYLLTL